MTWFPSLTITIYLARNYLAWVSSTVIILLCFVSLINFVELFQRVSRYGLDVSNFKIFLLGLLNLPTLFDEILPFGLLFGSAICFYFWTKSQQIIAIRSFGQNIWQTLLPIILTVSLIGFCHILIFNPISAIISQQHDSQINSVFKNKKNNLVSISASGIWLRDTFLNDKVIINGSSMDAEKAIIFNPILYVLNDSGGLKWLITANSMRLSSGLWLFDTPSRITQDGQVEALKDFNPKSTLEKSIMVNAGRPLRTISIYELSDYIDTLKTAGIPVEKLRVQFHKTLALPLQLVGLALLAASFTLLNFGNQKRIRIIVLGLAASFLYYFISDLIFLLGHNSRLPDFIAGWLPSILIFTISGFFLARGDEH